MACGQSLLVQTPPEPPAPPTPPAPTEAVAPPPEEPVAPPPPVAPPAPVESAAPQPPVAPPAPVDPVAPPPPAAPPPPDAAGAPGSDDANPWLDDGAAAPQDAPPAGDAPATPAAAPVPTHAPPAVGAETASPDPHGLATHLARMGEATRPYAEVPVLLAALLLHESETVIVVVPGLIDEEVGVAVVTDRRVLLVNGRRWNPVVSEFAIAPGLTVDGWQDAETAMLTFNAGHSTRLSAIVDKPLAFEAAGVVRDRVAAL